MSVDPLAANFVPWSTYAYALCNPTKFIDPDGRSPEPVAVSNREQRRERRANRKWDRKIRQAIFQAYEEGYDKGAIRPGNRSDAERYLASTVAALEKNMVTGNGFSAIAKTAIKWVRLV